MPQLKTIDDVAHLTAIINSVPTALVIVDEDGTIVLVNRQTEQLFRYSASHLVGEPVELLIPHRFREAHPELRMGYMRETSVRPMGSGRDLFGLRRDGTEFPIEIGLNPIRTPEGMFVVSAIVDITDRKRLEDRFRATIESAPTAMVMIDAAGTIVLVNRETESLFEYGQKELLGAKVEVLIPKRFRSDHPRMRTQYFGQPKSRRMGEGRDLFGLRKGGAEFPIEIGLSPVTTDEGQFVIAAIVDLTERKRSEEQLRRANEALEVSNVELQQFAFVASHDLQSPLRAICGFSQFLLQDCQGKLDEKSEQHLTRIVDNVMRMQRLVEDLLQFSRVESRSQPFADVDLNVAFGDAVAMLEASVAEVGCQVTCDYLPTVRGDRSQLSQLFQNLIGNAVKYHGQSQPFVHVAAIREGNVWMIAVRDNGIGIPAKQHEKIFEVFQRLHTQDSYPGTGIGLAVCRRIVHRHGGRIWVDSEPGVGSAFCFTLPISGGNLDGSDSRQ